MCAMACEVFLHFPFLTDTRTQCHDARTRAHARRLRRNAISALMASETAYEALPSGEYDPSSKPKLNDVEIPVNGQPQVYWAPVPLAPRRKWRGGCLQCCGSSSTDCKACCIATALPCVAFGCGTP